MNKQTIDLGYVLKQFPEYDFKMDTFEDRLRLQKLIYLLQAHGIYLGYDFSWYLHGPYCTTLSRRGFALERVYKEMPDDNVRFENKRNRMQFEKFMNFVRDKVEDTDFLEAVASLHILKMSDMSDGDAINKVCEKDPDRLNMQYCKELLEGVVKPLLEEEHLMRLSDVPMTQLTLDGFIEDVNLVNAPDMDYKHTDKTIYYMLHDAAKTDFHLLGKNIFRPNSRHPKPDSLVVDKAKTIQLLMRD